MHAPESRWLSLALIMTSATNIIAWMETEAWGLKHYIKIGYSLIEKLLNKIGSQFSRPVKILSILMYHSYIEMA